VARVREYASCGKGSDLKRATTSRYFTRQGFGQRLSCTVTRGAPLAERPETKRAGTDPPGRQEHLPVRRRSRVEEVLHAKKKGE
jgi:hypothetical protein